MFWEGGTNQLLSGCRWERFPFNSLPDGRHMQPSFEKFFYSRELAAYRALSFKQGQSTNEIGEKAWRFCCRNFWNVSNEWVRERTKLLKSCVMTPKKDTAIVPRKRSQSLETKVKPLKRGAQVYKRQTSDEMWLVSKRLPVPNIKHRITSWQMKMVQVWPSTPFNS